MYVVRKLKDGRSLLEQTFLEKENVAYYQDKKNKAAITVRYSKGPNRECYRVIDGTIRLGDKNYELKPAESDIKFRSIEAPDFLGTPYVLHEQSFIRRDNSDENKEKKDNIKANYTVEIAVAIDPTIWNFYSSMLDANNLQYDEAVVKRNIREVFSHYINGVNLLYSEIDDTGIEIVITLRTFVFFKSFDHRDSRVKTHKGNTYIDSCKYLRDLNTWDRNVISPSRIKFDHAMLFTRHILYWKNDTLLTGLSYRGKVCDKGTRCSLIQMGDFFTTVSNAAHELGHNLGAYHDGEDDAKDCDPKDEFIMAPHNKKFKPDEPYSRNPWLFSNCSIQSFKKVLSNKTCITNKGVFFNETEWIMHVKKLPGEVYTPNKQCELINGHESSFCGAVSPEICRFMKCTNPITNQCMPTYSSAARGTACGKNMWCIEGLCISKDLE